MRTRNFARALGLFACIFGLTAAPSFGAPIYELDLSNTPTTLPRTDEGMFYTATVKNVAGETPEVGTTLTCDGTPNAFVFPPPTVTYKWLRNGNEIPGETSETYILTAADEGKALQCVFKVANQSAASGTADITAGSNVITNVVTATGSGTHSAGSKEIKNLSITSGAFAGGQSITGPGIAPGTTIVSTNPANVPIPSKSVLVLSTPATVTGNLEFSAGPGPLGVGASISGDGIPPNTTITAVNGQSLTLSANATETKSNSSISGAHVTIGTSHASLQMMIPPDPSLPPPSGTTKPNLEYDFGKGEGEIITSKDAVLPCEAPAKWSGFATGTLTEGSSTVTQVVTAKGTGTLTAGSKDVMDLSMSTGSFLVGQSVAGTGVSPGTTVAAVGSGGIELSATATASGSQTLTAGAEPLAVGQEIGAIVRGPNLAILTIRNGGLGLPRGSGTGAITAGSNTITDVTTARGTGVLTAGSKIVDTLREESGAFWIGQTIEGTGIPPGTTIANYLAVGKIELSAAATASGTQALAAGSEPFLEGQTIEGPGIPADTAITAINGRTLTLSNNATETKSSSALEAYTTITAINGQTITLSSEATISGTEVALITDTTASWSFRFLRNGELAPHGPLKTTPTISTYELREEDVNPPATITCEVVAKDTAGNETVSISNSLSTSPRLPGPYEYPGGSDPTVGFGNQTSGLVTFELELPSGEETFVYQAKGTGWNCASNVASPGVNAKAICTREDTLVPGHSYPELSISAQLGKDAPHTGVATATISGGGALASVSDQATYTFEPGSGFPFGILQDSFEAKVVDEADEPFTPAGAHPYKGYSTFGFNWHRRVDKAIVPTDNIKDVVVDVPRGFVGNALATPQLCPTVEDAMVGTCPSGSAVGGIDVYFVIATPPGQRVPFDESVYPNYHEGAFDVPIYSLEPEFGVPAQFSFVVIGQYPYTFVPELRADEGYAIGFRTAPILTLPALYGTNVNLCDFGAKLKSGTSGFKFNGCRKATEGGANQTPLITNPTRCAGPPPTAGLRLDSWQNPQDVKTYDFTAAAITECEAVEFEPEAELTPTNRQADSPTGLEVEIEMDLEGLLTPTGVSQANLDTATVTFPKGMTINPAAAEGLGACSLAQVKMGSNAPHECPDSAKVGTVEIDTPLIRETLTGAVYVAKQSENPFNETLGLYMVFSSARDGVIIKVAGKLEPDPATGQLVSTFTENPEAPFSRLALKFNSGPRAPLINPPKCGTYAIRAEFSPWSAVNPANPTPDEIVIDDSTYKVNRGPNNSACPKGELKPKLSAGLQDPTAGAKSPFYLALSRDDGTQRFTGVEVVNPKGLTAYLKGVSICPESALANISPAELAGATEIANPSCPANSLVGTAEAGAGAGPLPFYVDKGKVYLAGPYKGAPVSLAVVTPAVAGPYDFGNVLVRTPLYVDPTTAQVRAVSDPIPLSLHGIALNVRDIRVALDRPNFTAAPTSCEPSSVDALVKGESATATVSNHFQAAGCENLGFKPKLSFRLFGGTKRGAHPKFRAILKPRPGDANIAAASVALPRSEFLENDHIVTICTRVQFAADSCPKGSIYGQATATTPLLDHPVSGPVYLRSSSHELPDLVVALKGPDTQPIEVELAGRIDSVNEGIRSSFEVVPDQPVSSFVLTMLGGKKGLLVNSRDLCKGKPQRVTAVFSAQNGKELSTRPELKNACKSSARKGKKGKKPPKRR